MPVHKPAQSGGQSWQREEQLWMKRQCMSISEHCCSDWGGQWSHAANFGNHGCAHRLVCTVLARPHCCSVRGAQAPSSATRCSPWTPYLEVTAVQGTVGGICCLPTSVHSQLVAEVVADSAIFSSCLGNRRDVLPLIRGRRGAELLAFFLEYASYLPP